MSFPFYSHDRLTVYDPYGVGDQSTDTVYSATRRHGDGGGGGKHLDLDLFSNLSKCPEEKTLVILMVHLRLSVLSNTPLSLSKVSLTSLLRRLIVSQSHISSRHQLVSKTKVVQSVSLICYLDLPYPFLVCD